jgi:Rad3-related DNA helicase
MADAVERALADDRVLVCEAGTGIGKTLLTWCRRS